jgi:mRNA interferase RelE/StbE
MSTEHVYRIVFDRRAAREFDQLPADVRARLSDPRGHGVNALQGTDGYRVRVGDYRAVFRVEDAERLVTVRSVGHRSSVYRRR